MRRWLWFAGVACGGAADRTDAEVETETSDGPSLVEVMREDGRFSLFLAAVEHGREMSTLESGGTWTVFAPTDEAFDTAKIDEVAIQAAFWETWAERSRYHLAPGRFSEAAVPSGVLPTADGVSLWVSVEPALTLNHEAAAFPALLAANGVVHPIDTVLTPPSTLDLLRMAGLNEFPDALEQESVTDALALLDTFTLFAPIDAGYPDEAPALPQQFLRYHVAEDDLPYVDLPEVFPTWATEELSAGPLTSEIRLSLAFDVSGTRLNDQAAFVLPDVVGADGRAHVIDQSVSPLTLLELLEVRRLSGFLDLANASGDLPRGIGNPGAPISPRDALTGEPMGSLMVFAPISSAFDSTPLEELTDTLARHIVAGNAPKVFDEAEAGQPALEGQLWLDRDADTVMLRGGNTANVVATDLGATNGLLHVIDAVLVPDPK